MTTLRKMRIYQRRYLKFDFTAGLVVFLVAIPLCLGIALASGAPLFSGIIAGIIGGIIVGSISESSVSVSGPAAGMVAIVLAAITQLGGFHIFLLALIFAGILQIIIGGLRVGFIADYIPSNVIQGLLCAIGILIVIKQLPLAFTHTAKNESLMHSLKQASETFSLQPLQYISQHINLGATLITLLSLAIMIYFDKTKIARLKTIPAPIIVVVTGVIINGIYTYIWPSLTQVSAHLVNIPINSTLAGFFSQFQMPEWSSWSNPNIYLYGFTLAAVASLETLLNLEAAEKLDKKRKYCSRDRELVAQGIGNTIAGLIGGIPITSVIVRSSVNIQAGAKTKFATILHGFLMLLIVMLIPEWLNRIPLASLAAILIYVGYKLSRVSLYKEMYEQGFARFFPFLVTVLAIVFTNLLLGILIGLFVSFFFILKDNSQIRLDVINEKHPLGIIKRLVFPQQMSFLRKAALLAELDTIPERSQLIIDARYTKYIDQDILEVLDEFAKNRAPNKRIALNMLGFKKRYKIHDHIDFLSVTTYDVQSALTPQQVLEILKEGNQRFLKDQRIQRNLLGDVKATSGTQHPMAVVLGCIDSRVPIETIFDMGVGDVFVVRIAGNVVNEDIIGSIEFACHIAGAKLILVLGHTRCGAIKAACEGDGGGHLLNLLEKIRPSIQAETHTVANRTSDNDQFLMNITKLNVSNTVQKIYSSSVILNRLINDGNVGLMGAMYDVRSGSVNFDVFFGPERADSNPHDTSKLQID